MALNPGTTITINGNRYDTSQLPPQAQPLITLLLDLQNEMKQIETRKTIVQLAQQQLLSQLNPMLPAVPSSAPALANAPVVLGRPSAEIPVTPAEKPTEEPSPFPENIPPEIRAQ